MEEKQVIEQATEFFLEGQPEKSQRILQEGIQNNPSPNLYIELGVLFSRVQKKSLAKETFEEGARKFPENPQIWNQLGLLMDESGKMRQAELYYTKSLSADSGFAPAWNNLGVIAFLRDNFSQAKENFQKALDLDSSLESARENLKDAIEAINKR